MHYLQILSAVAFLVPAAFADGRSSITAIVPANVYIGTPTVLTVQSAVPNTHVTITLINDNGYYSKELFTNFLVDDKGSATISWTPGPDIAVRGGYDLQLTNLGNWGISGFFTINGPTSTSSVTTSTTSSSVTPTTSSSVVSTSTTSSNSISSLTSSSTVSTTASLTTSTVYTTSVRTIYSCAASITNCPERSGSPIVVTDTIALYTTICPVAQNPPPVPTSTAVYKAPGGGANPAIPLSSSTATVYKPAPVGTSKYTAIGTGGVGPASAVPSYVAFTGTATRASAGFASFLGLIVFLL